MIFVVLRCIKFCFSRIRPLTVMLQEYTIWPNFMWINYSTRPSALATFVFDFSIWTLHSHMNEDIIEKILTLWFGEIIWKVHVFLCQFLWFYTSSFGFIVILILPKCMFVVQFSPYHNQFDVHHSNSISDHCTKLFHHLPQNSRLKEELLSIDTLNPNCGELRKLLFSPNSCLSLQSYPWENFCAFPTCGITYVLLLNKQNIKLPLTMTLLHLSEKQCCLFNGTFCL